MATATVAYPHHKDTIGASKLLRHDGFYIQEPPLPLNIQWPPFVPAMPRQIDYPLYLLTLAPNTRREPQFLNEVSEYMAVKDQTIVDERALLEEHQFLLTSQLPKHHGFTQHQWMSPPNPETLLARHEVRIRRLEDAHLHLRLRRARLEVSLLVKEMRASRERLVESVKKCPPLSSSSSSSSLLLHPPSSPLTLRPSPGRIWRSPSSTKHTSGLIDNNHDEDDKDF